MKRSQGEKYKLIKRCPQILLFSSRDNILSKKIINRCISNQCLTPCSRVIAMNMSTEVRNNVFLIINIIQHCFRGTIKCNCILAPTSEYSFTLQIFGTILSDIDIILSYSDLLFTSPDLCIIGTELPPKTQFLTLHTLYSSFESSHFLVQVYSLQP